MAVNSHAVILHPRAAKSNLPTLRRQRFRSSSLDQRDPKSQVIHIGYIMLYKERVAG